MTARAAQQEPATTVQRRLVPGEPRDGGYRALAAADGEPHAVRADLASAHRRQPGAGRRVLGEELRAFLLGFGCVVAWINGHTHEHAVTPVHEDGLPGGFWQVTTASHIDWPQQARDADVLAIACTAIDSDAPASYGDLSGPGAMAALARELAANDWQVRDSITAEGGAGAGTAADRNVILVVDWPRSAT